MLGTVHLCKELTETEDLYRKTIENKIEAELYEMPQYRYEV